MTIQQLRHFIAVCSELNYSKAAEKCFVSRQALRQSIAALENELQFPLFFMESNKLRLTDNGESLFHRAVPVVNAFTELEDQLHSGNTVTKLRIGVSFSLTPDYLPKLSDYFSVFSERNPLIKLDIVHMQNDELPSAIQENKLDCGLMLDLGTVPTGLERFALTSHPVSLLISTNDPLKDHKEICVQDLSGKTVCLPGFGEAFSPLFQSADACEPPVDFRLVENYFQVYYLVREQNAAAINRYNTHDSYSDYVRNIPIKDLPFLCCSFVISKSAANDAAEKLLKFLKRELKNYFSAN